MSRLRFAALHLAAGCSGGAAARARRGAASTASKARPRAGDAGVGQEARSPGAGVKMPFEIPIRP